VEQFQKSTTEPDLEGVDDEVVAGILSRKRPMENETAECMYYISGYLLQAIKKEGIHRKGMGSVFRRYANANSLDQHGVKLAQMGSLPSEKTDRIISNGGLLYPVDDFYWATVRIGQIYEALLTADNLLLFGPHAVSRIHSRLLANGVIRQQLSIGLREDEEYPKIVDYILRTYMHLKGKKFHDCYLGQGKR
jgi:hypothetical protein